MFTYTLKAAMTGTKLSQHSFHALLGCVCSIVALGGAIALWSDPAMAQVRGNTAPSEDQRRVNSGAKLTADTAPEETSGKPDEERLHDSYQPKGVDLGLFLLLPKLEVDESYNSNFFATQRNTKSEFTTIVRPEFKLRSRFKEHALNVSLMMEKALNSQYKQDNRLDGEINIDGRYDFSSDTQANVFQQFYARHEDRGSPDDARGVKPTPTQGLTNRTSVKHQVGPYTILGEIGVDRRTFDPVSSSTNSRIPNQDRDRWETTARGRLGYEIFPGYAAVTELSTNVRRYDDARDRNGYDRDSHGYRAEAGIGVDISQLVRGDFLVGYFGQNYRDPRLSDPKGLSVRATFNWTPDKLTIVVPSLERTVAETTLSGASSIVRTTASLTVRHELERNIILTGYTSAGYDDTRGVSNNNAWTYEARARGTYAFTPELFVGGEVGQKVKRSEATDSSYSQTLVMFRLGAQL